MVEHHALAEAAGLRARRAQSARRDGPIIDLRCRFGQGRTETTPLHIVVIVQIDERLVGLLVDRVLDIVAFEAGKIQAVPKVVQSSLTGFLAGLVTSDGNLIALIDLPSLLAMPAV